MLGLTPSKNTNRDKSPEAIGPSLGLIDSGKSLPMFYPCGDKTILGFLQSTTTAR